MMSIQRVFRQRGFHAFGVIGFWLHFFSLYRLWSHTSNEATVLGRYSTRFALVLVASLLLAVVWVGVMVRWRLVSARLEHVAARWRLVLLVAAGLPILVVWWFPIERLAQEYVAANALLLVVLLLQTMPDQRLNILHWLWLLVLLVVLMWPLLLLGSVTIRMFEPDEAAWADYSTSIFVADGVYARTWLQEPVAIRPGLGYALVGYGWLLENVSFNIATGRIIQFASYVVAFIGVAAIAWRLYGRVVGVACLVMTSFSFSFLAYNEYRPNLQLPAIAVLIVLCALEGRYQLVGRGALGWHFLCGLLAALSLQLHASGVVYIAAFSVFYILEVAWVFYRSRRWRVAPIMTFFVGVAFGGAVYYFLNIAPLGGIGVYLSALVTERGGYVRPLPALYRLFTWPNLVEVILVFAGLTFLIWRQNKADCVLLAILSCVFGAALLLDTQGYLHTFNFLLLLPVGVLLVDGLNPSASGATRRGQIFVAATTLVVLWQVIWFFLIPSGALTALANGRLPPFLYEELRPALQTYIRPNDVIVSTHELLWTYPNHRNLVGVMAETVGSQRWGLNNPVDVWERVQPTVVIAIEHQMDIPPGLAAYMSNHEFKVCDTLRVLATTITIYREQCAA
ncbi:MAG: hypothetical protein HZC41_24930 [Chloroflexi bacterium]|nr:hypothetical protein [Chloroflexota bacterium]